MTGSVDPRGRRIGGFVDHKGRHYEWVNLAHIGIVGADRSADRRRPVVATGPIWVDKGSLPLLGFASASFGIRRARRKVDPYDCVIELGDIGINPGKHAVAR